MDHGDSLAVSARQSGLQQCDSVMARWTDGDLLSGAAGDWPHRLMVILHGYS